LSEINKESVKEFENAKNRKNDSFYKKIYKFFIFAYYGPKI